MEAPQHSVNSKRRKTDVSTIFSDPIPIISRYIATSLRHIFVHSVVQEEISRQLDESILNASSSIFIICLFTEDSISTIMQFEEEVLKDVKE